MYCNNCGQQLQTGQQFCSGCGAAITGGVVAPRHGPDMEYHLRVLGILWIAMSCLNLLIGGCLLIIANTLFGAWGAHGPYVNDAPSFLHPLLSFIGILILLKGVAGLAAGVGLMQHQPWARPLAIILACVALLNMPFGTALAIYTFWVLLSSNAEERYHALAIRA